MNVLSTAEAAAEFAAACFFDAARAAIADHGRFVAALAGGTTPRAMYDCLAAAYATRIDWPKVVVLWSDERCVPPDHPASNYRMAHEALLSRVPVSASNVHRMRGEDEPVVGAAAYDRELHKLFGVADGSPPSAREHRIDFALLGVGDDGHTASLFPGARAVHESERWVEAATAPSEPKARITLTPYAFNVARDIMFLVTGSAKAEILRRVIEGPRKPTDLPAQLIRPVNGGLRWVLDAAAASALTRR